MKDNATFLIIGRKKFLIEDICVSDSGEVSYQIRSQSKVTKEDERNIEDFVRKLLWGSISGIN